MLYAIQLLAKNYTEPFTAVKSRILGKRYRFGPQ